MIIPSIDLMGGHAVQLIGGKEKAIDAGDPRPIAEKFRLAGDIAVIDLDAALGQGSNRDTILDLIKLAPCRVGGGIRDLDTALFWLDAGAKKIILGTAARPELLSKLPGERVLAALDAVDGEVVVDGWRTKTGRGIVEQIQELEAYVSGFLITFVESEGRLEGIDLARVEEVVKAAAPLRVTVAGGVTTLEELAAIDAMGADAQVGMALYTDRIDLADAIAAPLSSDRQDGLFATVVCDEVGRALGLAWSSKDSLREAVKRQRGIYHSRSRGLWVKGETSGATQDLLAIDLDCDRDALRFTVRQHGAGFCHNDTRTCWGDDGGLPGLSRRLVQRMVDAPEGSYTKRLFEDPGLLAAKLIEEAGELGDARGPDEVTHEAADVLYFALVAMARAGVSLDQAAAELDRRALKVRRRPGDAKPGKTESP